MQYICLYAKGEERGGEAGAGNCIISAALCSCCIWSGNLCIKREGERGGGLHKLTAKMLKSVSETCFF